MNLRLVKILGLAVEEVEERLKVNGRRRQQGLFLLSLVKFQLHRQYSYLGMHYIYLSIYRFQMILVFGYALYVIFWLHLWFSFCFSLLFWNKGLVIIVSFLIWCHPLPIIVGFIHVCVCVYIHVLFWKNRKAKKIVIGLIWVGWGWDVVMIFCQTAEYCGWTYVFLLFKLEWSYSDYTFLLGLIWVGYWYQNKRYYHYVVTYCSLVAFMILLKGKLGVIINHSFLGWFH